MRGTGLAVDLWPRLFHSSGGRAPVSKDAEDLPAHAQQGLSFLMVVRDVTMFSDKVLHAMDQGAAQSWGWGSVPFWTSGPGGGSAVHPGPDIFGDRRGSQIGFRASRDRGNGDSHLPWGEGISSGPWGSSFILVPHRLVFRIARQSGKTEGQFSGLCSLEVLRLLVRSWVVRQAINPSPEVDPGDTVTRWGFASVAHGPVVEPGAESCGTTAHPFLRGSAIPDENPACSFMKLDQVRVPDRVILRIHVFTAC